MRGKAIQTRLSFAPAASPPDSPRRVANVRYDHPRHRNQIDGYLERPTRHRDSPAGSVAAVRAPCES